MVVFQDTGNEDTAFENVPYYNMTVMVDVSDYNNCVNKPGLLDILTETSPELATMSPEEQRLRILDHCVAAMYIGNVMEKAFGDAFSQMR